MGEIVDRLKQKIKGLRAENESLKAELEVLKSNKEAVCQKEKVTEVKVPKQKVVRTSTMSRQARSIQDSLVSTKGPRVGSEANNASKIESTSSINGSDSSGEENKGKGAIEEGSKGISEGNKNEETPGESN